MSLARTYAEHLAAAEAAAGGPLDVFPRLVALRAIERAAGGNRVFPPAALGDREAFVRFHADFYFAASCGQMPGAAAFVDPALLVLLNRLHAAARDEAALSEAECRAIFTTCCVVHREARAAAFAGS